MNRKANLKAANDWVEATPADRVMASLDMAMPPVAPPASLWARIEEKLAAAELISVAGLAMERYDEGARRKLALGCA